MTLCKHGIDTDLHCPDCVVREYREGGYNAFNRNHTVLADFVAYCAQHPTERFWQALRNWSGFGFVLVVPTKETTSDSFNNATWKDTFYWEEKNQ